MPKVITFGESMVVFTPDNYGALRYENQFRARLAGVESNTAIGLAKLGLDSCWISRVGSDEFGHYVLNMIRAEGVDTKGAVIDPDHRTGIMFKQREYGGETTVFYYRENSAASHLQPEDLKPEWFEGADVLHLTGITSVLSDSCRETVLEAVRMAKERGICFSFDPNIRKKLMHGQQDIDTLRSLTLQADIVLLGIDEADFLFGVREAPDILEVLYGQGTAQYVAIKDGGNGAVVSVRDGGILKIPPYPCKPLETVGAGDGFNAGFLAGILTGKTLEEAGRMGGIAGALATQTTGDMEGYPDADRMARLLAGQAEVYR